MDVGMMMVFASYGWDDCTDARVWRRKSGWLGRADLASTASGGEHHFNDYSFVPDISS